jgi:hypothetical protein
MSEGAQDKIFVVVGLIDEQVANVHLEEISVSSMSGTNMDIEHTFSRLTSETLQGGYASAMTACTVPGVFCLSAFCYGGQPRLERSG